MRGARVLDDRGDVRGRVHRDRNDRRNRFLLPDAGPHLDARWVHSHWLLPVTGSGAARKVLMGKVLLSESP